MSVIFQIPYEWSFSDAPNDEVCIKFRRSLLPYGNNCESVFCYEEINRSSGMADQDLSLLTTKLEGAKYA